MLVYARGWIWTRRGEVFQWCGNAFLPDYMHVYESTGNIPMGIDGLEFA